MDLALDLDASQFEVVGGSVRLPRARATFKNTGEKAVTLVHPGDGSWGDRRTPMVGWVVNGTALQLRPGICGNINALKPEEVFELKPGQSIRMAGWVPPLELPGPGHYEIQMTYRNDPALEFRGALLGRHDPVALESLRKSTPCKVTSNTVSLDIGAPAP